MGFQYDDPGAGFYKEQAKSLQHGTKRLRLRVLEMLFQAAGSFVGECKTIGLVGHPDGMHCLSCSFADITGRIKEHVDFWKKEDRYKDAVS